MARRLANAGARRGRGPLIAAIAALLSVGALFAARTQGSVATSGLPPLSVSGNRLLAGGQPIQLRGVNRSGTEYMCVQNGGIFDGPSDDASVAAIASWHTNAVRVGLNEDCWLGVEGEPKNGLTAGRYQAAIENYVTLLHQHGLYAILDLHWSAPPGFQATWQEGMADAAYSPTMWGQVAAAFKNDPAAIFDLFNEPVGIDWPCWLNGCAYGGDSTNGRGQWLTAGMQTLVTSVRNAGANNVILLGGLSYANDLTGWLSHEPSDPQHALAASFHAYNFNVCNSLSCWNSSVTPVAAQVPIVMGEIGQDSCAADFIVPLMEWADSKGISYVAWAWDTWGGCKSVLIVDYAGTATTGYGQGYRAHLAALSCPCSLFAATAAPTNPTTKDWSAVELGMKFTADVNGKVSAVRFYKGPSNTGTHIGNLWTSSGQLLATAIFLNETASGWQQVAFAAPVAITAGTTYVVSYHTDVGGYAADAGTFTSAVGNPPLHGVANSVSANGVYDYGATRFPSQSFNASNYWVDLVFVDTAAPAVLATSPAANATGANAGGPIRATFNRSVLLASIQFTLTGPGSALVAGNLSYDDASRTAWLQPSAPLALGTPYTATLSGATDASGTAMSGPYTWSFITLVCPCSLFGPNATPITVTVSDPAAVELGMKFSSDLTGYITGIRFYKGPSNTGTHIGNLWSSTGQLLATATFSNETAGGWQQVPFAAPVAVTAGTTYVVSYHTNVGLYSATGRAFTAAIDNSPMHGIANSVSSNGVYAYGATQFPSQTYNATNYWVDVVFADTTPPTVVATSPAANATGAGIGGAIKATFNRSLVPASIQFRLTGPGSVSVPTALSYDDGSHTASLQPSAPLALGTAYTATLSSATDASGTAMSGPFTWSFTTLTCPCSLFAASATPIDVTVGDPRAVELGMKFMADLSGSVTGVRFYKGPSNNGTHVGTLWSSNGQALATATFSNETTAGWQQVAFATPVNITAGITYVVSYHTNVGLYSADGGAFSAAVDNPPLHGVANSLSANGVYLYSASSAFPSQSFNASNYWVDVVFSPS